MLSSSLPASMISSIGTGSQPLSRAGPGKNRRVGSGRTAPNPYHRPVPAPSARIEFGLLAGNAQALLADEQVAHAYLGVKRQSK